jgi:hypothetical protein
MIRCGFGVAGVDTPTLFDLVEGPLDEIARDQQGLKQIGSLVAHFEVRDAAI